MRDKTTGIRHAAQAKRQAVILRAETALIQLQKNGKPINYNTVSQIAKVSKAWLYTNLKQQIDTLRASTQAQVNPNRKKHSIDGSKESLIATLKKRIKDLESENKELRQQLEVAYGRIVVEEID